MIDYGVNFGPHRVYVPMPRDGWRLITWEHTDWLYPMLGYSP